MAFMIFDRKQINDKFVFCATSESFSLAGYNLLYTAWTQQGSPINKGWHITADELIRIHYKSAHDSTTKRLVIDFDPKTTRRIGLIELLDIYAFTWGNDSGSAEWTPLMLRFRDLFYQVYNPEIDKAKKAEILSCCEEPSKSAPDFVEFLYLNGPQFGWNWGMNGMTNAAFINGMARDYFRQFF